MGNCNSRTEDDVSFCTKKSEISDKAAKVSGRKANAVGVTDDTVVLFRRRHDYRLRHETGGVVVPVNNAVITVPEAETPKKRPQKEAESRLQTGLYYDPIMAEHGARVTSHPERPARVTSIYDVLKATGEIDRNGGECQSVPE